MKSKASAIVAFLALAVLTMYAEAPQQGGRGGGQRQAPSTTAVPSNDPKKVIETMQDNLGMLRGMQRNDSVNRIELWGTAGSKAIGGRNVTLTNWKISLNFTMNAMRFGFVVGMAAQVVIGLLLDRETYRRGKLRRSWKKFRKSPIVRRELWDQLKDYNRPDFHPDDSDATELVERWRNVLFGDEGTLNDKLATTSAA